VCIFDGECRHDIFRFDLAVVIIMQQRCKRSVFTRARRPGGRRLCVLQTKRTAPRIADVIVNMSVFFLVFDTPLQSERLTLSVGSDEIALRTADDDHRGLNISYARSRTSAQRETSNYVLFSDPNAERVLFRFYAARAVFNARGISTRTWYARSRNQT